MKISFKAYIRYVRKQKAHVQHLHAVVFAGTITLLLGFAILYAQYGYWHTSYDRAKEEADARAETTALTETPKETLIRLFQEGKTRFKDVTGTLSPLTGGGTTFERNDETAK